MSRATTILAAAGIFLALVAIAGCDSDDDTAGAPAALDDRAATDRDAPVAPSLIVER